MVVLGTTIHEFLAYDLTDDPQTAASPPNRHPGLEPGSMHQLLVRLWNGSRLKAGMTD